MIGGALIILGILLLLARLLRIDFWSVLLPLLLIGAGIYLVFRPDRRQDGDGSQFQFLGEIRRQGRFSLRDQSILLFIGDVFYDLSEAEIQEGETRLDVHGFIGDITLRVPKDVGVWVSTAGLLTENTLDGDKQERFLGTATQTTSGFAGAKKKIILDCGFFIADIKVETE